MSDKQFVFLNRRGITLVEVLVAAALLVILIAGIIAVISFSNSLLGKNIVNENAYTEAEGIADILISSLSSGSVTRDVAGNAVFSDLVNRFEPGYVMYVTTFSPQANSRQFIVTTVHQNVTDPLTGVSFTISGYEITVRLFDKNAQAAANISGFASMPSSFIPK